MVVEQELLPYWDWLAGDWWHGGTNVGAGLQFLITAASLAVLALVVGFLIALVRNGPLKAGDITYRVVTNGISELMKISRRRVWALARLAIKEAVRRRVIVALVIYGLILVFAGWYLQSGYREPSKLFFSFVLTATTYLVLLIALLVSAFSLPQDFKSKTIYTVVTKPVRAGDIVLGRILGFTIVGTALLAIMGLGSYVFVWRTLSHTHEVDVGSLEIITDAKGERIGQKGHTSRDQFHRHDVEINNDGTGIAHSSNSHEHSIEVVKNGTETRYLVGGPLDMLRARVPDYGKLRFLGRTGDESPRGISVGSEWTYRSYIEGGTQAAAIWTFSGIGPEDLVQDPADPEAGQVLPLELIVRVFRTFKGNIEKGIGGSIQLRNPDSETELTSTPDVFTAKDDSINRFDIPRKLYDTNQQEIDLLNDLVTKDGRLEVIVQCLDRAQYFGFAQPDCYIRLPDGSPLWNFIKSQVSIWMQMVLVIAIGVTCSTLVNGPVAMMFTLAFITLGFFRQFFFEVATGKQVGGGPVESLVRLVTQRNQMTEIPDSVGTRLMHAADTVFTTAMQGLTYVLPDFSKFSTVDYVAYGYNIPPDRIAQDVTTGLAYVAGLCVIGYFFLRTREVAK
jgi:ABC-type transport system involved in multi-copper enzyme maturation permease subunit